MGRSNRSCSYQASNAAERDKISESFLWGDVQLEGAMSSPFEQNVENES